MKKLIAISFIFIGPFVPFRSYSQTPEKIPDISIIKAKSEIVIDGILDDKPWEEADVAKNFWESLPFDTSLSMVKTEVRLTYDDNFIYVGAICYDTIEGDYLIQSLKRDFDLDGNDHFNVVIDPFNDQTNAFSFYTNPYGVQGEGLVSGGGSRGVDATWDNRWYTEATRHKDKWIVEMAIPFKTLRYDEKLTTWRINFVRTDFKAFQRSSWAQLGRNYSGTMLAFMGTLKWDNPPKKAGGNYAVIPYINTQGNKDYSTNEKLNTSFKAGLDGKIAVSSSLNLDVTVNPDFSQVDVDQQVTNLTRFSLFFPERRNFFIENSDLFGEFGFSQIRPFFSRRIGLQNGGIVPILGGARLSGKLNDKLRIGAMSIQTDKKVQSDNLTTNGQNFSVGAFQWLFQGSNSIGAIVVNKQEFGDNGLTGKFNRVFGSDLNIASQNGKWRGKVFSHHSFSSDGSKKQNNANASWLMHNSRKVFAMWNHEYVGKNYNAEVGFVPRVSNFNFETGEVHRLSFFRLEPIFDFHMYPKGLNKLTMGWYNSLYTDSSFKTTENVILNHWSFNFKNASFAKIQFQSKYVRLLYPTDITRTGDTLLQPGGYFNRDAQIHYRSNGRKRIFWNTTINYGSFFSGEKSTFKGFLGYRWKHLGNFGVSYRKDIINIPGLKPINLDLVGPRMELTFSKSMFLTTFIQYNTQINNVNINSRFQWRFKPMSDLFVVYSDNYDSIYLDKKNRALVIKFVYWFSL